jgi:uncharacterized protein (TIGR03000 family)
MLRQAVALTGVPVLVASALGLFAAPALAWPLGGPLYAPSYYGYNLDDAHPGYYGGGRYREYYSYGRGWGGFANYPDSLPAYPPLGPFRTYRVAVQPPAHVEPMPITVPPADGAARLEVQAPPDAEIWIEGSKTQQTGPTRWYFSPPLGPGVTYAYQIRARWMVDGRPVEQTQTVAVSAGARVRVQFSQASRPETLPEPKAFPLSAISDK